MTFQERFNHVNGTVFAVNGIVGKDTWYKMGLVNQTFQGIDNSVCAIADEQTARLAVAPEQDNTHASTKIKKKKKAVQPVEESGQTEKVVLEQKMDTKKTRKDEEEVTREQIKLKKTKKK